MSRIHCDQICLVKRQVKQVFHFINYNLKIIWATKLKLGISIIGMKYQLKKKFHISSFRSFKTAGISDLKFKLSQKSMDVVTLLNFKN